LRSGIRDPGVNLVKGESPIQSRSEQSFTLMAETVLPLKASQDSLDREAAVRATHTVKGVAGNIGATEIQKIAAVVEAALKEETEKEEQLDKLDEVLLALIGNLRKADLDLTTPNRSDGPKPEIDQSELKKLLEEFRPILKKRKPKPVKEMIEKIDSFKLPDEIVIDFEQLSTWVGKYKYKDAQETLNAILENIPEEN